MQQDQHILDNLLKLNTGMPKAFAYLAELIRYRLAVSINGEAAKALPGLEMENKTILGAFVARYHLNSIEVITILLALVPHVSSSFLNTIITDFLPKGGEFPEFGGVKGKNHRGILPTGETIQFILAGNDFDTRIELGKMFEEDHVFAQHGILSLGRVPKGEPKMSGCLVLEEEYVELLTTGNILKPKMSGDFPAERIATDLEWDDLVLQKKTLDEIKEIETWLKYNHILMEDRQMKHRIKPGYRVMFHGPPGTGKTLTAGLLGKYTGCDVYRIDLSLVVSKYIGETEKNLSKLFDKAKSKNWILFFDEADAIFGKRTNVRDAHDKYANQEVSYLLQRIEAHPGLVILASNFKSNIDTAFTRRFQSIIEFENPGYPERMLLWKNNLPRTIPLKQTDILENFAKKYAITGANIVNVIQFACLKTLGEGHKFLQEEFLIDGIKKEYIKEGKTLKI